MVKPASQRSSYTHNNAVRLIHGGAEFFRTLEEMIDGAKESLHIQMYIFEADDTGVRIANALKRAALRQVKVHMLLDGYASRTLPIAMVDELRAAGIFFRWFQPLFKGDN